MVSCFSDVFQTVLKICLGYISSLKFVQTHAMPVINVSRAHAAHDLKPISASVSPRGDVKYKNECFPVSTYTLALQSQSCPQQSVQFLMKPKT